MLKIKPLQTNYYGDLISEYYYSLTPKIIEHHETTLIDILTNIMVGDKNLRLGPIPDSEHLEVIREIINKSVSLNVPIPILIAWGGRKTIGDRGVDVAEVAAIYQLKTIEYNIKRHYNPGIDVRIRIEDLGAYWIYRNEGQTITKIVDDYSEQFVNITNIFGNSSSICPVRESWLMKDKLKYFELSSSYSELLADVVQKKIEDENADLSKFKPMCELLKKGWKGDIPIEQINHYIHRYESLYPELKTEEYIRILSDYLGGSKARYELNGRAEPKTPVNAHISISFIPPIPGSPTNMFSNTLYYRTVPIDNARTHISPWRGKGYLSINKRNVKLKVTSWKNTDLISHLTSTKIEFSNLENSVVIDSDFLITA